MARRYVKYGCLIETGVIKGRRYFRCKNLKRPPTAEEIVNELKSKKRK